MQTVPQSRHRRLARTPEAMQEPVRLAAMRTVVEMQVPVRMQTF